VLLCCAVPAAIAGEDIVKIAIKLWSAYVRAINLDINISDKAESSRHSLQVLH
jgi:hypothetical protein